MNFLTTHLVKFLKWFLSPKFKISYNKTTITVVHLVLRKMSDKISYLVLLLSSSQ